MWKELATAALLPFIVRVSAAPALQSSPSGGYGDTADYVIVGGGPAGFVLAEQLSRNRDVSVVLLEAGPENAGVDLIDIPGLATELLQTQYTWNFSSQPESILEGERPFVHQGRGFGGGAAVNYLGACRGAPSLFDEWAQISGDDGLKWSSFFNDFKSTVHFKDDPRDYPTFVNDSAYGDGPLELTTSDDNLGFVLQLVQTWKKVLGLSQVDMSDGHGLGVATGTQTILSSNRTRTFPPTAYGSQMRGRSNVRLLYNAQATKIGFQGKRASSVNYVNPVTTSANTIRAKEIIVTAGAFNSPKLLMLSGVGPADQLKKLKIPVVADVPQIGQNLYDHYLAFMEFQATPELRTMWQYTENATYEAIAEAEYKKNGSGPLGVTNGGSYAASRIPDSVFAAVNDTYHPSLPADRAHLLFQYSSSTLQPTTPNVSIFSTFVSLVQPESTGRMALASADYRDDPLIYSNYYGSAGDKAAIIYGYKQMRKVVSDPAIKKLIVKEIYPGRVSTSDEDIMHDIAHGSGTFHHPMGTVALGTVVQGKTYRVKGLQGLRVIDSSTFPKPTTCHPMATVYALAYHAAQQIKTQDRF